MRRETLVRVEYEDGIVRVYDARYFEDPDVFASQKMNQSGVVDACVTDAATREELQGDALEFPLPDAADLPRIMDARTRAQLHDGCVVDGCGCNGTNNNGRNGR